MEESEVNLAAQREESLKRLKKTNSRATDESPFFEKLINNFPFPSSLVYKFLFKLSGIQIGDNVKFLGKIRVKLRGRPENITIGDSVTLGKNVDLRNRENGKIQLAENVYLDDNVRLVAARDGFISIEMGTEIGQGTVINSGGKTSIGKFCMVANNVNINSSSHGMKKSQYIKEQGHEHGVVDIGNDVWIGSFVTVVMNSKIGDGAVIGANSLVRSEISDFSINVGTPAKFIGYREN